METQDLLTLEEKEFLVELLKPTIAERKYFRCLSKIFREARKVRKRKIEIKKYKQR